MQLDQELSRNTLPIVVQKYGGACLETPAKIRAVASALADLHWNGSKGLAGENGNGRKRGHSVVVVVSAMGKTTDDLIKMAYQVSPRPNRRELDMLLTTGERISMSLLSMALTDLGVPSISFTGSQAGVFTDHAHSSARILDVRPVRVREELERGRLVVLAGYQGVNPLNKEITTLGRGGSDTTAVAMASALKASRCEMVKAVDGVCSADPGLVVNSRTWPHLDYASLAEMCFWGARVLHFRCVEMAHYRQVPLVIKKWGSAQESTLVTSEVPNMESGKVLSVNSQARVEHVELDAADLNHGFATFAEHLQQHTLPWPQLLASAYDDGKCRIMLTGDSEALDALLHTFIQGKGPRLLKKPLSSVTVTCFGGVSSELPHRMLQILTHQGIVAEKYILSPHSITVFVNPQRREEAIRALHALV